MFQPLAPVYKYLRGIVVGIFPLLIVLYSISLVLTNPNIHKDTLKSLNFYNDLSLEVQSYDPGFDEQNAFIGLIISSTIDSYASPGWIQNFSEQNIDNTTQWLKGERDNWNLYVPTQDVNLAVTDNLNSKVQEFSSEYSSQITVCDETKLEDLKQNGFDTDRDFCLPETVKSGEQTLSEFFEFTQDSSEKSFLNTVLQSDLSRSIANKDNSWYDSFNRLRDYFVIVSSILPVLIFVLFIALCVLLWLAKGAKLNPFTELQKALVSVAYGILLLSAGVILAIGGSSYLTSGFGFRLLTGFDTPRIGSILSWQFVLFSFNLVSLALYTALALFVLSILVWFLSRLNFFKSVKVKNQKLATVNSLDNSNNYTLDGQFRKTTSEPDISSASEFQNWSTLENFEMPDAERLAKKPFNYDALQERQADYVAELNSQTPDDTLKSEDTIQDYPEEDNKPLIETNSPSQNDNDNSARPITWF
ncbi:MAG: hypothetical protein AAGF07_05410 [Patescibacteria group bacterium]